MSALTRDAAARALSDPSTSAEILAQIVSSFPDLGHLAAQHPHAYAALIEWVREYAPPAAPTHTEAPAVITAIPVGTSLATTPAASPTPAENPKRKASIALIAAIAVAALALGAAGVTGALAISRLADANPTTSEDTDSGSSPGDPADVNAGEGGAIVPAAPRLPSDDTASGAADLSEPEEPAAGAPIVFILDASGSMVRETAPGRTRMDDAREALTTALEVLDDDAQVGVLVFGTGTGSDPSERERGCHDVTTVHPLETLDRSAVASELSGVSASGFTPLGPALRAAAEILPADGPATIVLISDGVDTCSPPPSCEVASELRAGNPALVIHAVGFAIDDDEQAQQLQCIGRVGAGGYISASNMTQLSGRLAYASRSDAATVLSDTGYAGVRLGMTVDEVRGRVAGFEIVEEKVIGGVQHIYVDCSWGTIEFQSGVATAIIPATEASTFDGVSIGDPVTTAATVYGTPVDGGHNDLGAFDVYRISNDSPYAYRVYGGSTIERIVLCRCLPASMQTGYSTWEITYAGVGPLQLGMTVEEVHAVLPDAAEITIDPGANVTWYPLEGQRWLSLEIHDGTVSKVTVRPWGSVDYSEDLSMGPALPHMRGIRIGDRMSTVRNIVPGGTDYDIMAAGLSGYVTALRTGQAIKFNQGWDETPRVNEIAVFDSTRAEYLSFIPEAVKVDLNAFPAELQGTWCEEAAHYSCFSLATLLASYPKASFHEGPLPSTYQPAARDYILCTPYGASTATCGTQRTLVTYFPVGVDSDCEGAIAAGWTGCTGNYVHDLSRPRLVWQSNYQHGDLYADQPPLYLQ